MGGRKKPVKKMRPKAAARKTGTRALPPAEERQSAGRDVTDLMQAEELRKAETLYHELVETAQDLIWQCDAEGRYTYLNAAWEDVLGYPVKEMLGRKFGDFQDPGTARRDAKLFNELLQGGMVKGYETEHIAKNGGTVHLVFNAKFVHDETGKVTGTRGTAYDVTERNRSEQSLRQTEERLSRAQVIAHVGDWEWEIATNKVHWSDELYRIYGFEPRSVVPDYGLVLAQMHPDSKEAFLQAIDAALKEDRHFEMDYRFFRKDGAEAVLHTIGQVLRDAAGAPVRMLGIVQDITERALVDRKLRESEDRFRSIFEQATDGILIADPELKKNIEANKSICAMLGYTRDEILSIGVADMHPKKDLPRVVDLFERQVRGEISLASDIPLLRKDGSVVYADVNATRVTLGGTPHLIGIFRDITERRQADAALKASEKQLAESQRIAHIGSWEHNLTTGEVVWSDELFRILGLDPRKDAGDFKVFFDRIHPDDRPVLKNAIDDTVKTGRHFSVDYRFMLPDGRTRVLHAQAELRRDDTGAQIILSGTGQDITDRKHAEANIRRSEEFIRNILDTVDEGFIVIDRDYRIVTANKAYCGQAGVSCDEVIGRHCFEISHKASRPCYEEGEECAVRGVFGTGKPYAALHRHVDRDGQVLFVETKAFPLRDSTGRVTSAIETINNITERHLLEEERLKTQKLESIGTLAGGIAHDFNNLLQGVFGYISMARATLDKREKASAMLDQAEKALHQSVNLTTQLLTFSKGGKPARKTITLRPVIENAVMFALSGSRLNYRIDFDDQLRPVDADEGQIAQVIQNIVLNADQAMPLGGTIEIRCRNIRAHDPGAPQGLVHGDFVAIAVKDSGIGIPVAFLSRIFDPYFTTKEKGSGLGLATSYSIIKNHDGLIDVRSEIAQGSVFTIYLPAAAGGKAEAKPAPSATDSGRTGKILVMDDEEIVRLVAGELIRSLGHEADFAEHGAAAIRKFREARDAGAPFDVVILDLTIRGGMGGLEALGKLREIDPDVKAVVSSGYSDDSVIADFAVHGFRAFLKKPYDLNDLRKILSTLLPE